MSDLSDDQPELNQTNRSNLHNLISDVQLTHSPIDYAGGIECSCGEDFQPEHGGIDVAEAMWADHVAGAVMEMLTIHVPPIVASAIHAYADSELIALRFHKDGTTAVEQVEDLHRNAAQIANYATTHKNWSR